MDTQVEDGRDQIIFRKTHAHTGRYVSITAWK